MIKTTYSPGKEFYYYEDLFYNPESRSKVARNLRKPIIDLSSGQNLQSAPEPLLSQLAGDIRNPLFYMFYDYSGGMFLWLHSVVQKETLRSKYSQSFPLSIDNVLVIPGITTGFNYIARYFSELFPKSEALILVPAYYAFGVNIAGCGLQPVDLVSEISPKFLPSLTQIKSALTPNTRLLFITSLGNPTGTYITAEQAVGIIQLAKEYDFYIVWDEASYTLTFPGCAVPNILDIAFERNCLNRVILLSGLSKDRSLPGLRLGWIIADTQFIQRFVAYNNFWCCNPPTIFAGMVFKELLLYSIHLQRTLGSDIESTVNKVTDTFLNIDGVELEKMLVDLFSHRKDGIETFFAPFRDRRWITNEYSCFAAWLEHCITLYQRNLQLVTNTLEGEITDMSEVHGGFNLLAKLSGMRGVDQRNFISNLFLTEGVELFPGPSFGLTPTAWETHYNLGFWVRITFSRDSSPLKQGLERFIKFKRQWIS